MLIFIYKITPVRVAYNYRLSTILYAPRIVAGFTKNQQQSKASPTANKSLI